MLQELKSRGAKDVVRVCEPTYSTEKLNSEGIKVYVSIKVSLKLPVNICNDLLFVSFCLMK